MINHRIALAMIGMATFLVCGQWPGQAAAEVNIDVGGVRIQVGDRPPPPPVEVVVLTRGPIHEAFAQPVILDEGAGFMITRRPSAPLDEIVPEEKPEGNHVLWIPGYWSWDTDRNDFIWVSGCWRAVPPNTSWVPGYWAEVRGGYVWTAGFWDTIDAEEIEYLPAPPASLEEGPQGIGSPDSVWIPGCWVRHEGRYAWRPGFWEAARANWVWEPAHYVSTPRGWVYVDGYWDYPIDRRGVAFLPIYAPPSLYGRPDFRYSPDIVLDVGGLMANLFISPERHQYYFGDYYGPAYARQGFHPWYESRERRDWYDPIFVHEQWQHRTDSRWVDNQRTEYDRRRDDTSLRPAATYEAMRVQAARLPEKDRNQVQVARPMKEVVAAKTTPFKFDAVDAKTRAAAASQAKEVHAYKDQRAQWESPAVAPKAVTAPKEVTAPKAIVTPKEVVVPKEPVPAPPREVVAPKEPVPTILRELPKPPAKEAAPPEKTLTPDRGAVGKGPPAGPAVQPGKVKIPKPPIAVREPVQAKELAPPPRPTHPNPDPNVQPKQTNVAPSPGPDVRPTPPKGARGD